MPACYVLPLGRTLETAQILAEPNKLEVQTRDGFREISHGRWEQMTRREVEKEFPEEAAEWEKDPYTFAPVGGESGLAVTARALPVLVELVRSHQGETFWSVRTRRRFGFCSTCSFGSVRALIVTISNQN